MKIKKKLRTRSCPKHQLPKQQKRKTDSKDGGKMKMTVKAEVKIIVKGKKRAEVTGVGMKIVMEEERVGVKKAKKGKTELEVW